MFTRAVFFSNSNRTGLNCVKSKADRSCSRNASASLSEASLGTFLFIGLDFFLVHVTRADGSNESLAFPQAKRKRHENRFAVFSPANADEPFFLIGMRQAISIGPFPRPFP